MILPTKHVRSDRALIGVGAEVLDILNGADYVAAMGRGAWPSLPARPMPQLTTSGSSCRWTCST